MPFKQVEYEFPTEVDLWHPDADIARGHYETIIIENLEITLTATIGGTTGGFTHAMTFHIRIPDGLSDAEKVDTALQAIIMRLERVI